MKQSPASTDVSTLHLLFVGLLNRECRSCLKGCWRARPSVCLQAAMKTQKYSQNTGDFPSFTSPLSFNMEISRWENPFTGPRTLQPGESGTIKRLNSVIRLLTDLLIYGSVAYIWRNGNFQQRGKDRTFNLMGNVHVLFICRAVRNVVAMPVTLERLPAGYTGE